ncbi:MAG TPA: MBL fold metallo-hydrolase [Acidimicrobiia bacterium]|nr:MBL fold metallo-hydrolase [Acidimicrobiia bacterium]
MFDQLADGVYRRRYESLDLNIGVVIGEEGVLIVDTRATHVEADELRADLSTLTEKPVRWVIDTHWHWDHTFGNSRFPGADIWGHHLCRKALVERGDSMKQDAAAWLPDRMREFDEVVITPPTRVFEDAASLDLGGVTVTMSYHGLAHTDADIVVTAGELAFFGDLVEEGAPPVFDDGYPLSWPGTLRRALDVGSITIVPGHGDLFDRGAASTQLEEIEAVAATARRCIDEGLPVEDAARLGPYPEDVMKSALSRAVELHA